MPCQKFFHMQKSLVLENYMAKNKQQNVYFVYFRYNNLDQFVHLLWAVLNRHLFKNQILVGYFPAGLIFLKLLK